MKPILAFAVALLFSASLPAAPTVFGEYIEARTCDVWTGPCFSNSEANTTGELGVLGWVVRQGSWDGHELKGLSLAIAVRADNTLSTTHEGKVRAVVYIDEKASEEQGRALVSMARTLAGKYLQNVVDTRRAKITYVREGEEATLAVGDVAKVRTRALLCGDVCCGNEEAAYPPLSKTCHVTCAKSLEHRYAGTGLDARWSDPMKRSAMLGEFSL